MTRAVKGIVGRSGVILLAGVITACAERPAGTIALEVLSANGPGGGDSGVVALGTDTLFIRRAELVVREMKIAPADAGDCEGSPDEHEEECPVLAEGPMTLRPPLGAIAGASVTVRVPPDDYSLLQFQILVPDTGSDGAFLAAHPDFRGSSVRLDGVYSRKGVRQEVHFATPFNEREELTIEPPLRVPRDSVARLVLRVDAATWFLDAERTALVDPGAAGPGQPYESLVRDNIRRSLEAFRAQP